MGKIIQLKNKHKESVNKYLSVSPLENLRLQFSLEYGDLSGFYAYEEDGEWLGVINFDWETIFYATDKKAITQMANFAIKRTPFSPRIVAKKETMDIFWKTYKHALKGQPVYSDKTLIVHSLEKEDFDFDGDYLELQKAEPEDLDEIVRLAAAMNLEELGVDFINDPQGNYPEIILQRINCGMYYFFKEDNKIKFLIMISFFTPYASQIDEGYVPPEFRGKRYATRCIGYFCKLLLSNFSARICGVANQFNPAPLKYLKTLGFKPKYEIRCIYFNNDP